METIMDTHHLHTQNHSLFIPTQLTSLTSTLISASNDLIYDETNTTDLLSFDPYTSSLPGLNQQPMQATIQNLSYPNTNTHHHHNQTSNNNNSATDLTFLSLSTTTSTSHLHHSDIDATFHFNQDYSINQCDLTIDYNNHAHSEAITDQLEPYFSNKDEEFSSAFIVNSGKWNTFTNLSFTVTCGKSIKTCTFKRT